MERICEPELMEAVDQAQAYAAADFSDSDQAAMARIFSLTEVEILAPGPLRIVDLGCGPGNITIPLAARYPEAEVVGLDGSAAMLAEVPRHGAAGRPTFRLGQLPDLPTDLGRFDLVVSNSLLHHLHDPGVLWRSVLRLAAPGAAVYVRDLRRPDDAGGVEELVKRHAAEAPEVLQRDYRASLHAAFRPEEVEQQLVEAGLDLQVQSVEDRYLEVWGSITCSR